MTTIEISKTDRQPTRLQMSYEEFLEWAGEDVRAEWVNGEVIVHTPPKNTHQSTVEFLYVLLNLFVQLFRLGKVRIAPFEMKLAAQRSSREPDILFIATEHLDRLTEDRLTGPADLVIEVLSDDSVTRDRRDKFWEFAEAGVPEYWTIDPRPRKHRADFFRLNEQGQYDLFATEDDERVESYILPGFWLRPAWLWQADTLDPLAVFLKMRGIPADQAAQLQELLRGTPPE